MNTFDQQFLDDGPCLMTARRHGQDDPLTWTRLPDEVLDEVLMGETHGTHIVLMLTDER